MYLHVKYIYIGGFCGICLGDDGWKIIVVPLYILYKI